MNDHMSTLDRKGGEDTVTEIDSAATPPAQRTRRTGYLDVLIQGMALFSDGYNIQVVGYMLTVLAKLWVFS